MIKKIILIFLLFISFYFYSEENKENKDLKRFKEIEFSIGVGLTHTFYLSYSSFNLTENGSDMNTSNASYYPYGQGVMLSVPFSFVYYPNKNFGFGFKINNGFNLPLYQGLYATYFDYESSLYFVNKVRTNNKSAFLLEYGIVSDLQFIDTLLMYEIYNSHYVLSGYTINKLNIISLLGPGMFIGGEFKTKKGYATVVGCIFDALFYINPNYNESYEYQRTVPIYGSFSLGQNFSNNK